MSLLYTGDDSRRAFALLNDAGEDAAGWDDQQVTVEEATGGAGLAVVTFRDTQATLRAFSDAARDRITFKTQLSHRWDRGPVRPHIHWVPLVLPVAPRVVRFLATYAWALPGQVIPAAVGWTTLAPIDVPLAIADAYKHMITSLGVFTPPAGAPESSILIVVLSRDGASVQDTYTDGVNNVGILQLDTHFRAEKMGSFTEFPGA